MRVPVYERQVGIAPMPGARVSAAGGAEAYGAPVGAAIHELGGRAYQIAQDVEDAKTLSLFNAFRKESQQYHEDPDKGVYQTRILGGAQGVTAEADKWLEGKITEYDRKMPSSRAANNFRRMAEQYRQQRGDQNSRFEASELKKYREGEADAAIKLGLDDIAQNYGDDNAVERAKQGMTEALEMRMRGASPEAKRAALAEMDNQAASVRLSRMLEEDPQKAAEWFREHQKEFTADGVVRAEKAVNNALEVKKRKAEGEEAYHAFENYWNTYHKDSQSAYDALYADSSLTISQKDNIWSRMRARADREEHDYITYWRDRLADSQSAEEADALIRQSGATGWKRAQMEGWAKQKHKPATFHEKFGDWYAAWKDIETGAIKTEDELVDKYGGLLTAGSVKTFIREIKSKNKPRERTGFSEAEYKKKVQKSLNIEEGTPESSLFMTFTNDVLDAAEKEKGRELNETEITSLVNQCKKEYIKNGGGHLSEEVRLRAQGYEKQEDGTFYNPETKQTFDLNEYRPGGKSLEELLSERTPPDRVDRKGDASFEGSPSRDEGEISDLSGVGDTVVLDALGKSFPVTSEYGKTRTITGKDGKKSTHTHHGLDLGVPEGTAVKAPIEGLKVKQTAYESEGGYHVDLSGKVKGQDVEIIFRHLKPGSFFVEAGQTVSAGQTLAKSGDSGNNSTGAHLHIETKIGGKFVDPREFYRLIGTGK